MTEYHSLTINIHIIEEINKLRSSNQTHFKTITTIIGNSNLVILLSNHLQAILDLISVLSVT